MSRPQRPSVRHLSTYAITAMDKIGGWEEENWVGSRFAASMWKNTKEVICNGQNHMQNYRLFKIRSNMEGVNWVRDGALEHVGIGAYHLLSGSKSSGSPVIRHIKCVHSPVVYVMVLGNNKPRQWTTERCGQFGDSGSLQSAFLEDEYSKIVLLEICTNCIDQHA